MSRQSKIEGLRRLAAPGSGATPAEREVAKEKLKRALMREQQHPRTKIDPNWNGYEDLRNRHPSSPLGHSPTYRRIRTIGRLYEAGMLTREEAKQALEDLR